MSLQNMLEPRSSVKHAPNLPKYCQRVKSVKYCVIIYDNDIYYNDIWNQKDLKSSRIYFQLKVKITF